MLRFGSNIRPRQGSPCGVVVNVLDSEIVVSEFELQSRYCIHFEKDVNLIPSVIG